MIKSSQSKKDTAEIAKTIFKKILDKNRPRNSALVLGFCGELGTGKTTMTQEIAKLLGIKEKIISPTFVIQKIYSLKKQDFKHLIHIDTYRLESPNEIINLGWPEIIKDKNNLIIVEWADRIKNIMPEETIYICFSHKGEDKREIEIKKHDLKK